MNYEGTLVKAPPRPGRRMKTPLPQQSSFSSMEEGSLWSAQETTAIARMKQYVNNSDCIKLVEDFSLGPGYTDVDVKQISRKGDTRRQKILHEKAENIEIFKVKEGEQPVASKWRWDDWQRQRKPQEEKAWKESRGLEEEHERKWYAAYEDVRRRKC